MDAKAIAAGVGGLVVGVALASFTKAGLATPGRLLDGLPGQGVARSLELGDALAAPEAARARRQAGPRPELRIHTMQGGRAARASGSGLAPETISGVVTAATRAPLGELDGLVLDGGIVVKFPPHVGLAIEAMVGPGQTITATGWRHVTPLGELHFSALELVLPGGETLEVHGPGAPLPPPPGAGYSG